MVPFLSRGPLPAGRDAQAPTALARLMQRAGEARPGIDLRGAVASSRLFPPLKRLPTHGLDPVLGRIGALEVRLATRPKDVRRAQRLRYRVFYEEMAAVPSALAALKRRDVDEYDAVCDHLLVIDHAATEAKPFRKPRPKVVGTYRLLRQEQADRHFGFYTAGEYDIGPVLDAHRSLRFLELGRSCVLKPYRTKRTVELLWHGIWTYVLHHRIDAMLGCASLDGTDPDRLALPLSFLHHFARASDGWCARALPERHVAMDRISREAIDPKSALQALPPLVKGYLRLGATFGDGAVIDRQFGTTDVFVVLPVAAIAPRYIGHFGAGAERHAA
ncbi:GNAT family N-acetyltransferase [Methylobacterium sp. ID0610]|uniref:GNAT family N-acetyltransferase n=1 Tax=Methylobacterium carpenticola TaxID=3344827 RepID=UPI003699CE17